MNKLCLHSASLLHPKRVTFIVSHDASGKVILVRESLPCRTCSTFSGEHCGIEIFSCDHRRPGCCFVLTISHGVMTSMFGRGTTVCKIRLLFLFFVPVIISWCSTSYALSAKNGKFWPVEKVKFDITNTDNELSIKRNIRYNKWNIKCFLLISACNEYMPLTNIGYDEGYWMRVCYNELWLHLQTISSKLSMPDFKNF